ncbi:MAG: molybdopterin-guanine dinucleotide biosynthesis protein B [Omnitrophica WOR_2 bacterium RIFCSPLOWO2_02_FULL_63_16]|nr:MAG: molybdopterin-guanine dinucleotide biosynthesis protein B [Omnitrophica WOR_2 bacterium GWA2_63_20]OGX18594.1 MAG: molybdopterin-guanine dinucleotide biosynthesis protein B [Omnitrophica WOR_2 bacterium GWF2_63_9]OGX31772.1 MAG: molybdopterin-guanine dinucleotide biosynthesis protein B [Omnitrophica WOR_2 bacterium RIFCSPHIGHO2_12_FULL_64_13]OGX35749.1 MAG: molybdopterin-guanine dinucleotide biosynthesis protein B [Omnitrophica WOR_2 bacterium RIFCSPHIGHO2_02_FULL_63_39]OGX45759.1 MAG: 
MVHVIGASDSGKTTLIERLIPRLRANGIRIGTVKHTHHGFEMDRPGKDSWRHVQAGADAIAVISPERAAWIMRTPDEHSIHEATSPMAGRVDLVLVEGFKHDGVHPAIRLEPSPGPRLEIGTGACRVGVHPGTLLPDELEQLTTFCVSVFKERQACQPSSAGQ